MTPGREWVKGSVLQMEMVVGGERRLPERRRRSVVLPAPLAGGGGRGKLVICDNGMRDLGDDTANEKRSAAGWQV